MLFSDARAFPWSIRLFCVAHSATRRRRASSA